MRPPYPVIDAHVHIAPRNYVGPEAVMRLIRSRRDADEIRAITSDPQRLIAYLDECGIEKIVMIYSVSHEVFGITEKINDFAAGMARHAPDRLIPFGGIDPRRVPDVAAEMDRLLGELGMRGIKLHPPHQHFRFSPLRTRRTPGNSRLSVVSVHSAVRPTLWGKPATVWERRNHGDQNRR